MEGIVGHRPSAIGWQQQLNLATHHNDKEDNEEHHQPNTTIIHTKGRRKRWQQRGKQQLVLKDDGREARGEGNNDGIYIMEATI